MQIFQFVFFGFGVDMARNDMWLVKQNDVAGDV